MDMLSHCFMSVIWVMKYVWHGWITLQTTTWPQTTPQTCSTVTLDIGTKSLNNDPHQWCSGPMIMMQVWIYYPTISWVLYQSWSTSARGGSPHKPHHDHTLHPRHAQLLPWISEWRAWIMVLISGIVVQEWWCRYEYTILPFHEFYMKHGPPLIGVDHPTDTHMSTNYTPAILSCYPGYWNQELEPWSSSVV